MKYSYPVKFASNSKAAYIRNTIINSGALFIFYRNTITSIPEPCDTGPTLVYAGPLLECETDISCLIFWAESLRDVRTACYRQDGFNGNAGTYSFFAYFAADSAITCPPGWQGVIESTSVRAKVTKTSKYTKHRTFEEVNIDCDWPVGCPVTIQAPSYHYQTDPMEDVDYVNLTLKLPSTINEAEAKWDELSEGVAGAFPLSGVENRYFYAYGTEETGGDENCKIGNLGEALSGSYVPPPWMDGHVATDLDTGERIEETIDTTIARIELRQSGGGWQDSGIWSGNSIYQVSFSSGYWGTHVFDLDG